MNLLESALRRIASDLERHGRHWALVGGFAVSARAEPRFRVWRCRWRGPAI